MSVAQYSLASGTVIGREKDFFRIGRATKESAALGTPNINLV